MPSKIVIFCLIIIASVLFWQMYQSHHHHQKKYTLIQSSFMQIFCDNKCPNNCDYNFKRISIPQTNYFNKQNLSQYNISSYSQVVGSAESTYKFDNKTYVDSIQNYIGFYPEKNKNLSYQQNKLSGVILYFHPTLFGLADVPSAGGPQILAIASLFASQNLAVVFPNYIGYNPKENLSHPYLSFPTQNIQAGYNAANAFLMKLISIYPANRMHFPLYTVGYSQGSAYSLMFESCLRGKCNNMLNGLNVAYSFQGSVGLDGPYSLNSTILPFLLEKVGKQFIFNQYRIKYESMTNLAKPALAAMFLLSFCSYYKSQNCQTLHFSSEFYHMLCQKNQSQCNIQPVGNVNIKKALMLNISSKPIVMAIFHSALGKQRNGEKYLNPTTFSQLTGHNNSLFALIDKKLIMESNQFNNSLAEAEAINQTKAPSKPVLVFTLKEDSMVTPLNSEMYKNSFPKVANLIEFQNKNHKKCAIVSEKPLIHQQLEVDHIGGQLVANIFALAFIQNISRQN